MKLAISIIASIILIPFVLVGIFHSTITNSELDHE